MNRIIIAFLVVLIIGNIIGLFVLYKYLAGKRSIANVRAQLERANNRVENLFQTLDKQLDKKMVFLHHSVGRGMLNEGGLRDSLLELGILVKGATYGDEIGENTDIKDWLPKFRHEINRILTFKAHPDQYYNDATTNDIVMFKSCYPNSDIAGEGELPGNPMSPERTLANYRAVFKEIGEEIRKNPDRLFIYLTTPPLVPEATTGDNARRALEFNRWLVGEYLPGYEKETGLSNFVIFDLFSALADENGYLKQAFRRSAQGDSHPNSDGYKTAAGRFMEFFHLVWAKWQKQAQG